MGGDRGDGAWRWQKQGAEALGLMSGPGSGARPLPLSLRVGRGGGKRARQQLIQMATLFMFMLAESGHDPKALLLETNDCVGGPLSPPRRAGRRGRRRCWCHRRRGVRRRVTHWKHRGLWASDREAGSSAACAACSGQRRLVGGHHDGVYNSACWGGSEGKGSLL